MRSWYPCIRIWIRIYERGPSHQIDTLIIAAGSGERIWPAQRAQVAKDSILPNERMYGTSDKGEPGWIWPCTNAGEPHNLSTIINVERIVLYPLSERGQLDKLPIFPKGAAKNRSPRERI